MDDIRHWQPSRSQSVRSSGLTLPHDSLPTCTPPGELRLRSVIANVPIVLSVYDCDGHQRASGSGWPAVLGHRVRGRGRGRAPRQRQRVAMLSGSQRHCGRPRPACVEPPLDIAGVRGRVGRESPEAVQRPYEGVRLGEEAELPRCCWSRRCSMAPCSAFYLSLAVGRLKRRWKGDGPRGRRKCAMRVPSLRWE